MGEVGMGGLLVRYLGITEAVAYLEVEAGGVVRAANAVLAGMAGVPPAELLQRPLADVLTEPDAELVRAWAAGGPIPPSPRLLNFVTADHQPFTLRCLAARLEDDGLAIVGEEEREVGRAAAEELIRLNNAFATQARELSRRSRELEQARQEMADALAALQASHDHLKRIQEVVPICMRCSQVKRSDSEWQPLLQYLRSNDIFLSHGYCPDCYAAVSREFGLEDHG